jgi:hypothetical protein
MDITYVVLSCEGYINSRYKSQRETWLKDKNYICISSNQNNELNIVGWNTDDTYQGCSLKYLEFFRNIDLTTKWIMFVDDDTFVYTDRIEDYITQYDPNENFYIGFHFDPHHSMSGGAGFLLSKNLYQELCKYVRNTSITLTSIYTDETLFQWINHINNVHSISDTRFHWNNTSYIYDRKTAFTFHYVKPENMYIYYKEYQYIYSMDISILIPTMKSRERLFQQVLKEVQKQISECPEIRVEVLWESDNGELTLGQKRNVLMDKCNGKYHCFIDDDDVISPTFLKTFVPMIQSEIDYDCADFLGAHYERGRLNKLFYHSMNVPEWYETNERFFRSTSPMNMIKTSIVRQVRYKDIRNTEDHEFSKRLMASGLLKKEFKIPNKPIYHYIDGVKQDREEWKYRWKNDYIELYKDVHFHPSSFSISSYANISGNIVMPYTKLFQGK